MCPPHLVATFEAMRYVEPRFSLPAFPTAATDPANCTHGWLDRRGLCVFCGHASDAATVESFAKLRPNAPQHIDRGARQVGFAKPGTR